MKKMLLQALAELDRLFYAILDDNLSYKEQLLCQEKFDYIYEKLEKAINAMED